MDVTTRGELLEGDYAIKVSWVTNLLGLRGQPLGKSEPQIVSRNAGVRKLLGSKTDLGGHFKKVANRDQTRLAGTRNAALGP